MNEKLDELLENALQVDSELFGDFLIQLPDDLQHDARELRKTAQSDSLLDDSQPFWTQFDFLEPPADADGLARLDHFEIVAILGRGGSSIVFAAFDTVLQRRVAIKVLCQDVEESTLAEARIAADIYSPYLVQVINVSTSGQRSYIVLEYVAGTPLSLLIQEQRPLSREQISRIMLHVAAGLGALHSRGIIHGDLKPGNILVSEDGTTKIADFGLALQANTAHQTQSQIAGTPCFMSPEQTCGDPLDCRSDLFSLGGILYAMCTGQLPFGDGLVHQQTIRQIRESNVDTRRLPNCWKEICEQLLRKKRGERLQTAKEVADEIRRLNLNQRKQKPISWLRSISTAFILLTSVLLIRGTFSGRSKAPVRTVAEPVYIVTNQPEEADGYESIEDALAASTLPRSGYRKEDYYPLARPTLAFKFRPKRPDTFRLFYEATPSEYHFELLPDNFGMLESGHVNVAWYRNGESARYDAKSRNFTSVDHALHESDPHPTGSVKLDRGTNKFSIMPYTDSDDGPVEQDHIIFHFYVYPDLTYANARLESAHIYGGERLVMHAEVVNKGTCNSEPGTANLFFSKQSTVLTMPVDTVSYPKLKPGESHKIELSYGLPVRLATGLHYATLQIDAKQNCIERDELPTGNWKNNEGTPFLPSVDPKGTPRSNNVCSFALLVEEPVKYLPD